MGRIVGITAIKNYLGVTESTVMDQIHHQGLPAVKESGIWIVKSQAELDRWRTPPLASEVGQRVNPPKPEKPAGEKEEKPKARSRRSKKRSK